AIATFASIKTSRSTNHRRQKREYGGATRLILIHRESVHRAAHEHELHAAPGPLERVPHEETLLRGYARVGIAVDQQDRRRDACGLCEGRPEIGASGLADARDVVRDVGERGRRLPSLDVGRRIVGDDRPNAGGPSAGEERHLSALRVAEYREV